MARKDALLRLHGKLQTRRLELLRLIAEELGGLQFERGGRAGTDDADVAADSMNREMISQLAEMESRELLQIERALARLREGNYGSCEACGKKIPVARLNALPYTTVCIECQREMEINPRKAEAFENVNWQKVYDSESSTRDVSINLADLEYKLS